MGRDSRARTPEVCLVGVAGARGVSEEGLRTTEVGVAELIGHAEFGCH